MRRLIVPLTGFGLCFLLAVAGALAAGAGPGRPRSVDPPTTLVSDAPLDGGYGLASDAGGAATIMWTQEQVVGQSVDAVVDVRQQGVRGGWGPTRQLGVPTQTTEAQLAVASSGAAGIVWTWVQGVGAQRRTVIADATRARAGAGWSAPRTLWSNANADGASLSVAVDAAGEAVVAWSGLDGATNVDPQILTADLDARTGAISARQRAAGPERGGLAPEVAVNADGAAVLSFQRQLSPASVGETSAREAEMAVYRSAGGSWGGPVQLGAFTAHADGAAAAAGTPSSPTSAVSPQGTAAVAWAAGGGGVGTPLEVASRDPTTGRWSPPHTLSSSVSAYGLVPGPGRSLVAVWGQSSGQTDALLSAASATGASWSPAGQIALIKQGTDGPDLAAGPQGRVELTPITGVGAAIEFATRSTAGRWSGMSRVGTGDDAEIASGPRGGVTVVWESPDSQGQVTLSARGAG